MSRVTEFLIYHRLLVEWVCNLTEYLLFQLHWLVCEWVELHLLLARQLVRTREWLLAGVSAACTFLFATARPKSVIFIFFWQDRLDDLSLCLLAAGCRRAVNVWWSFLNLWLIMFSLRSLVHNTLLLLIWPCVYLRLYFGHLTEWLVVVHKVSACFLVQTWLWEGNNKQASNDFEDVLEWPFRRVPISL